jgi:hypothetical protein
VDIPLSSTYSVLEEKERWTAILKRKGADLDALLIVSCQDNLSRTTKVKSLMETKSFQGRPLLDPFLIELNNGLPAVSFTGNIEFRKDIVKAPVIYFDTREMSYYLFLISLEKSKTASIEELTRIASGIQFRNPVDPPITEEELNLRKFMLAFMILILVAGSGYGLYYKRYKLRK